MKQYTILFITEFSHEWNSGWWKKSGFELNGHKVIPFDPDAVQDPVDAVFRIIKDSKPDFILHSKDEFPPSIYREMRQFTKVIQWYPDPVIPDWLPPYVNEADVFLTMSEGLVTDFRKINPNSFWLTEAVAPSFFEIKEITESDVRAYSADVTFVGNLGSKPVYLPRRKYLQAVIKNGFHLKWWGQKIPRKFSTIPLLLGKLGRSYGGKFVWGEEHAKIARLSKIYLGFDARPRVCKSMSERLYIAVACGAFYMCQYVDGIEDIFMPDKEIVTFQTEEEMVEKIKYYIKNDDLRMTIARAGQERVLKEHTYEVRARQLIEIVEKALF
ncbi:MAG: glycosyltransferase [Nitrospirae bacterium]|nr:glycosyltransferase [Nitrospirota bacterium]